MSIMLKWKYFQHTGFTCNATHYRGKLFGDFGAGSTLENIITRWGTCAQVSIGFDFVKSWIVVNSRKIEF